jgi:alkylation response protein AidB-like acyl-CoA dehydrogenase
MELPAMYNFPFPKADYDTLITKDAKEIQMDFKLTEEQVKRRSDFFEVCKELEKKQPPNWVDPPHDMYHDDESWNYHTYCAKEFAKRGWLSFGWPAEYGGTGTMMDRAFLSEARGYYRIPGVEQFGIQLLSPTLLEFGTEEQKRAYLPRIAAAEIVGCQLWSEPNAGSDLANVSATAIRKGDEYIINGQKSWTTGAHYADYGFGLFRTDPDAQPKQRGLSFILIPDIKAPGITVVPYLFMNISHSYNDVFFDDVHVPVSNLLGKENDGWRVTRATANSERSGLDRIMELTRQLDDLVNYCNETKINGELLAKNPIIRNRLAEMACEIEAARTLAYRVAWLQDQKKLGALEASAVKVAMGDTVQRMAFLGADILGPFAQVKYSKWAPLRGYYENAYQLAFSGVIAMGTNEIQRNIIAWTGLGLPRMR